MLGFKKLAFVLPVAALALYAAPVSATGVGGGEVDGVVDLSPGVPVVGTDSSDTVTFQSTLLNGVLVDTTAGHYAGSIPCGASGGGSDSLALGSGSVGVTCGPASGLPTSNNPFSASLSGSYTRVGVLVVLPGLTGTCTLNTTTVNCNVKVAAVFLGTGTSGSGTGTSVVKAQFAGVWAGTTS